MNHNINQKKIIGGILAGILVINMILFAFGVISVYVFWVILAAGAGLTFLFFPKSKQ